MPDSDVPIDVLPAAPLSVPNSAYTPARILVNPRCVTTYAGVSHTQLALDLFGSGDDDEAQINSTKYILEDWEGAPESFVCQEQRYILRSSICHSLNTAAGKPEAERQPKPSACLGLLFMTNCDRTN